MRELVRYLLKNRLTLPADDWTVQGFGFMRLRVSDSMRLHIWDSRLREPAVSDIHDHTQWAFTSHVLSGSLVNIRFQIAAEAGEDTMPHTQATLNCGIGGGMVDGSMKLVHLKPGRPELYLPGQAYHQEPDEVHRTMPADGTVTLIEQKRSEVGTARVFWPVGSGWGNAVPRHATRGEIEDVGGFALSMFPRE